MAKADEKTEEKVIDQPKLPYINNQIHWISKGGTFGAEGAWPKEAVEERLNQLYEQGYKLLAAWSIGQNPEAYGVQYVFVLKDG